MTQHERIIKMLQTAPVCGSTFLEAYMPTYSQRIGELRKKGYRIYRVKCPYDEHRHQSGIATYELSKHQGGTYDDVAPASLFDEDGPEPPERDDFDQQYADMKERANDEPELEPPGDDVEDTFHTSARWPDDEADHGHDSAVDQALGEGVH
jgi:hypothetical protein